MKMMISLRQWMKKVSLPFLFTLSSHPIPSHPHLTNPLILSSHLFPLFSNKFLEQDSLIQTLATQNNKTNKQTTQLLLLIPLLSIIPYLPSLFNSQTSFLSLLSITSLCCTAYLLYSSAPAVTGFSFIDKALNSSSSSSQKQLQGLGGLKGFRGLKGQGGGGDEGPINTYLPYLNLGLCVVLSILGAVGRKEVWLGFAWLPGFVLGVVVLAKWVMGGVDPEGELGSLRYGFKGA